MDIALLGKVYITIICNNLFIFVMRETCLKYHMAEEKILAEPWLQHTNNLHLIYAISYTW